MINVLHIGLTYKCNMNCNHCFVKKNKDKISTEEIKSLINYLDKKGLMMVIYTYGEPLLASNFDEISEYVSSKKIAQTLMTNGSLLNEKNISILEKNNVKNIMISLDSIDEIKHDNNRNYMGAYKNVFKSLELLDKSKFNVGLAVTIDDNNVEEMYDFVELAQSKNLKKISFLLKRENGKICDLKKDKLYFDFYRDCLINDKYGLNITFHDYRLVQIAYNLMNRGKITKQVYEKEKALNSCHNDYTLSVSPNGDLFKCNLSNKKFGNIYDYKDFDKMNESRCNFECFNYCSKLRK